MNNPAIEKYLGKSSITLAEAMQKIDVNTGGILFLTDEKQGLIGCITDGDIRRFLLAGGKLEELAVAASNKNPKVARTIEEARNLYHKKNYVAIPVLDAERKVIDIFSGDGSRKQPHSALHVPVVINAGGRGTRLDPFTRVLPKPLIPVGERPIIEHIMNEFQSYSCDEFHIIVNYKKQLIKAYFSESESAYNISWYDEEKPLGTGGGLSLLKGKLDTTFFFTNCDNLLTANYERMLEFHSEHKNIITMICAYKNFYIPYGVVDMGVNGKIEGMREKPLMTFLTNTGIYIVEPEVLEDIQDNTFIGFPDIVEMQRQKGKNVAVFPVSENDWMDMGQLSELEKMRVKLYGEQSN